KDLIQHTNFLINYKQSEQSLDTIIRSLLSNGLAYQLIKHGYINDNFTLYTSIFHGNFISASAQNFIIHNIEPNIMDEQLILEENDITAIISECGVQSLSEPCLYNISILNYLLKHDPVKADIMVQSLIQFGNNELNFLQAYLNGKNKHDELIKKLTTKTKEILKLLITQLDFYGGLRRSFVNAALEHLSSEIEYNIDDEVSEYLQKYYSELPVLFSSSDKNQSERIALLYSNAAIRVPELRPLSEAMRNTFIAKNLYEINVENLKIALDNETNLALDVASEKDEEIYHYLLRNLEKYLQAVVSTFKTVTSSEHFIGIIDDVLASKNPDDLYEIIENASDHCIIENLNDVQKDAWQCLAEFNRFTATFDNITSYISAIGAIDKYIENILIKNTAITDHESVPEDEREKLAIAILHADKNRLTSIHRAQLVRSLKLKDNLISASDLPIENSDLYILLLKNSIIEDDATIYEHLLETDWSTRESYIQVSKEFKHYITPELLHGDLADFLTSNTIELDTKISIVEQAEEFTKDCSKNDLKQLARFAISQNQTLPTNVIEDMANNDIDTKDIILLLASNLNPSMDSEQLFRILKLLKGDYSQLISTGKDQPKIPNTPENRKLISILKTLKIVNSFRETTDDMIKIFKKHK
ncbi:DNA-binding protein, partial [Marinomonas spartinae]|nr:DNA-binding protein [Marinomonas spartinae]